jgi:ketosteroid isomerase-like protein
MRTILPTAFLTFMLIAASPTAIAQSPAPRSEAPASAEEEIKTLELKLADLIVHGQWDEYEKHLTSDYTHVATNGTLETKDETMAGFRKGPRTIIVMEPEELHARTYGQTAILQGKTTISWREAGRLSTKVERSTQVFVKQEGQWLLATEHETMLGK